MNHYLSIKLIKLASVEQPSTEFVGHEFDDPIPELGPVHSHPSNQQPQLHRINPLDQPTNQPKMVASADVTQGMQMGGTHFHKFCVLCRDRLLEHLFLGGNRVLASCRSRERP